MVHFDFLPDIKHTENEQHSTYNRCWWWGLAIL